MGPTGKAEGGFWNWMLLVIKLETGYCIEISKTLGVITLHWVLGIF